MVYVHVLVLISSVFILYAIAVATTKQLKSDHGEQLSPQREGSVLYVLVWVLVHLLTAVQRLRHLKKF